MAPGSVTFLKCGDLGASHPALAPSSSTDSCLYPSPPWGALDSSLVEQGLALDAAMVSICDLPQVSDACTSWVPAWTRLCGLGCLGQASFEP